MRIDSRKIAPNIFQVLLPGTDIISIEWLISFKLVVTSKTFLVRSHSMRKREKIEFETLK